MRKLSKTEQSAELVKIFKPCWKCGRQPFYVTETGERSYNENDDIDVPSAYLSCVGSCMTFPEKYTIAEWQNHPRPGAPDYCREPYTMSELAGWIRGNGTSNYWYCDYEAKPKKVSWLQKLKKYDDLQARCNAAESMRDHYKTIMSEALRDRDLHAKVADNWQQRLIDQNEIIGKRLKFSVGNNHITITIGNPITLIESFNKITVRAYSQCSKKDTYNWKTGVIQSVENFCEQHEISKTQKREIMKALAKKYPEVFCDRTQAGD